MTEEQNKNVEKWVAALRSGKYEQTTGKLRDDRGYCCLGVACEVLGIPIVFSEVRQAWVCMHCVSAMPFMAVTMLGLNSATGVFDNPKDGELSLAALNDLEVPFSEIADLIERRPPGLFAA